MSGIIVCLSAAVMGVDYGWQPVAGGGIEYIIQIEPELLDSLKSGHDIFSDLPASVRSIRSYRITVGNGRLPHQGEPPPTSAVVPAGGPSAAAEGGAAKKDGKPAEIDLSQMPGPVLGPAMILNTRGKRIEEDEPPHIAEVETAAPLHNRVAGYRETRERQGDQDPHGASQEDAADRASNEKAGGKVASADKQASEKKRIAQTEEPESPSDRDPEKPAASAVKSALVQLGLFTSLCCNVFLLWVATGQRSRYRALVRRMFDGITGEAASPGNPTAVLPRWERLAPPEKEGTSGDRRSIAE